MNEVISKNTTSQTLENTGMLILVAKFPTQIDRMQLKKEV